MSDLAKMSGLGKSTSYNAPVNIFKLWPVLWMILSMMVVAWDSLFVILRPRSLPGNDLAIYFYPYKLYIEVDKAYGDLDNSFTSAQAWLNVAEIAITGVAVSLVLLRLPVGLILGLTVNVMTFWKTVLYVTQYTPLCSSSSLNLDHVDWKNAILVFILPSGVWLLMPFLCICHYFQLLRTILRDRTERFVATKNK